MGLGGFIKSAAKGALKEVTTDVSAFAGGANKTLGLPTVGIVKGAAHGNVGDIAAVGTAALAAIPVARGASVAHDASALPLAERLGLGARAVFEKDALFHGTSASAAEDILKNGFSAGNFGGKVFTSPSVRVANDYAMKAKAAGEKPAILLVRAAEGATPHVQGRYQTIFDEASQATPVQRLVKGEAGGGNVTQLPQDMVTRVRARVMQGIQSARQNDNLAQKIAQTRDEIVKLGGTPPTGPFKGATPAKLSAVTDELSRMGTGGEDAQKLRSSFEGARAGAKDKALRLIKGAGDERGSIKLPGGSPNKRDFSSEADMARDALQEREYQRTRRLPGDLHSNTVRVSGKVDRSLPARRSILETANVGSNAERSHLENDTRQMNSVFTDSVGLARRPATVKDSSGNKLRGIVISGLTRNDRHGIPSSSWNGSKVGPWDTLGVGNHRSLNSEQHMTAAAIDYGMRGIDTQYFGNSPAHAEHIQELTAHKPTIAGFYDKVKKAVKGGEEGRLKLAGTRDLTSGEVKVSTHNARNFSTSMREPASIKTRSGRFAVAADAYKLVRQNVLHGARFPKN